MNPVKKLLEFGQSPWYDNIKRSLLIGDGLKKLIRDDGIRGVTSNPSIFENAINSSTEYDEEIYELIKSGKSAREIYDELTIRDVSMAADILDDVFRRSKGEDGYVSIEVLPEYAHDVSKTINDAKRIFKRIGKENIMIKVPGTKESPEAIKTLISEGINVNVTLLFSMQHYEAIVNAYIDGLKDRLKRDEDLDRVNSVASVFISRLDTKIDNMLEKILVIEKDKARSLKIKSLIGRSAVAHTKMIYQRFKDLFSDENFGELQENDARIQKVLWASTSTKNPSYSDVKYVEELVAPQSINTIPDSTLAAFRDHGKPGVRIENDLEGSRNVLEDLASFGINVEKTCQEIQDEGVKAFQVSFDKLISSVESKISQTKKHNKVVHK
ncbi:MAG: transaldolase [Candidatus Omnitrophica bacterium CG07_land_8_20_14_0_80_42_15]|uniref:Transaldolase n=1 Tax=Candidatus Aquitaenariimonas noxiae TaxID=1974741 RepID=A0A2J0KWR2_9BACT|nr:MAG: transaldolase [Candidatus Omnitrophica bacterium CG07_land_8_20_14_0_80_42_15]